MVRQTAAQSLAKGGNPAVPFLLSALNDPRPEVREYAANALAWGRFAVGETLDPLLKNLQDSDAKVRAAAARALGELRDQRAVEPLVKAMGDQIPWVSDRVSDALAKLGDPAAPALIAALASEDPRRCSGAAKALAVIKAPRAFEPLLGVIRNASFPPYARVNAASALAALADPKAIDPLLECLKDGNPYVRRGIARVLVAFADSRVTARFEAALQGRELEIVAGAHAYFIRKGDPQSVPILIEALMKYGDAAMAEAYINCGNHVLAVNGEGWAADKRYRVERTGAGSGTVHWGQQ
jgi:HEAT repeat protein